MVTDRFQEILQGLDAIVWEADPETLRFSFVSGRAEALLGYPVEEWFERDFWADHIHPEDRERALAECRAATEAGRDHEFEYRSIAADGREVWIRDIVTVSRDANGDVAALRGVMVDVTKQRRAESDLRFQVQLLDQVDAAVIATDAHGRITHWNMHAEELFQRPRREVLNHLAGELVMLPPDRSAIRQIRAALERGENVEEEFRLCRKDRSSFSAWVRAAPVLDVDGQCAGFVAVCVDVTHRKRAQDELEQRTAQQAMVASLGQRALEGVGLTRLMDEVTFVLAETLGADMTGILELLRDENCFLMQAGAGWPEGMVRTARVENVEKSQAGYTIRSGDPVVVPDLLAETRFEPSEMMRKSGARSTVSVTIAGRGHPFGVLGAFSKKVNGFSDDDVNFLKAVANVLAEAIERQRSDEETRHRALHDPLTNLPNRTLFLDRLDHALRIARRNDDGVAVLFLDLDQFKGINDSLGHHAGDELLLALAPRLMNALRPSDTVARFGGDEFVILCEEVRDREAAKTLAERIAAVFERPFMIGGREHWITASIGIALGETGSELPENLIRDADAAMYGAKERGRARYEFYDERMRPRTLLRLQTEHDLRRAVERGELRLFYQPLVDLDTGRITDVEALIRWDHPERGLLAPGDFIPIAESSDLIVPVGKWVLEEAGRQAAKWRSRRRGDAETLRVCVNVSARQITGEELFDTVEQVLRANDLPGSALALELTESALMEEAESPTEVTTKIKALGVDLVLDDFGTGYSSLSYLQRFPIDKLKIDRSFIAGLDAAQTASIVTAVVNMAQALSLDVVAEGVETEAQLYALRALGCRQGQGFLFARPMPADEIDEMLDVRWAEAPAA